VNTVEEAAAEATGLAATLLEERDSLLDQNERLRGLLTEARAQRDQQIQLLKDATVEIDDMNSLFDLQWKRTQEATELWRAAHPGNDLVLPDLGVLITWLMERADAEHVRLQLQTGVSTAYKNQRDEARAALEIDRHTDDSKDEIERLVIQRDGWQAQYELLAEPFAELQKENARLNRRLVAECAERDEEREANDRLNATHVDLNLEIARLRAAIAQTGENLLHYSGCTTNHPSSECDWRRQWARRLAAIAARAGVK